jgi:hypothetical protein
MDMTASDDKQEHNETFDGAKKFQSTREENRITLYTIDSTLQVSVTKKITPSLIKSCFINLSIIQDRREGPTHMCVLLIAQ